MAQTNMPKRNGVRYDNIPESPVSYDTSGGRAGQSGLSRWYNDVSTGITKDILKPTIRNLTAQFIDLISSSVKTAIMRKIGGGVTNYDGYTAYNQPANGYYGNAMYNPNNASNRFNVNDGYAHNQPVGVGNSAPIPDPWKNVHFYREVDGDMILDTARNIIDKEGYITVHRLGHICHQSWDWSYDNYGWTNLSTARIRYNIIPFMDAWGKAMPFDFADFPDPIYINKASFRQTQNE